MTRTVHLTPEEAAHLLPKTATPQPRRKYLNKPTVVDGITFSSKAEARRWGVLRQRVAAGEIADLERQPRYILTVNGVRVGTWTGDFRYRVVATDEMVVEDVKSPASKTQQYRLRKRLMAAIHGVEVSEVS